MEDAKMANKHMKRECKLKLPQTKMPPHLQHQMLLGYGELEWSVSSWNVKCYNHLDLDIIQPFLLNIYLRET